MAAQNLFSDAVAVALCGGVFIRTAVALRRAADSATWPGTSGRVLRSRVRSGSLLSSGYVAHVAYRYYVNGTEHEGEQVSALESTYRNREAAADLTAKYVTNASVVVYYDPSDPSVAVLEPGIPSQLYLRAVTWGLGFIVAAVALWLHLSDPRP